MNNLQARNIFKYILLAIVLFLILFFLPELSLALGTIIAIVIIFVVLLCIIDYFMDSFYREKMRVVSLNKNPIMLPIPSQYAALVDPGNASCNNKYEPKIKRNYPPEVKASPDSNFQYNSDMPGYFLENDGRFGYHGIPYDDAENLIVGSRYNHLMNQHNFNILWSPHTHIGKGRGYLN